MQVGRDKARYTYISAGSNTSIATGARTLYGVFGTQAGSIVRIEDGDIGQNPNFNGSGDTDTVYMGPIPGDFGMGIGFNSQINIAATSNAKLTIIWE